MTSRLGLGLYRPVTVGTTSKSLSNHYVIGLYQTHSQSAYVPSASFRRINTTEGNLPRSQRLSLSGHSLRYPDKSLLPPAGPPRPLPPPDCTCGSQWVEGAAAMVAGLSNDVTLTLKAWKQSK